MRHRIRVLSLLAALSVLGVVGVGAASGQPKRASAQVSRTSAKHARARMAVGRVVAAPRAAGSLKYLGSVNLKGLAASAAAAPNAQGHNRAATPLTHKRGRNAAAARAANPNPPPTPLVTPAGPPVGFVGLTTAGSANVNGFDVEPPDQGLCAHGSTVIEAVNIALQVYDESGARQVLPVSLNSFFGLPPAVSSNGKNTTFGPFLSDPRCYYDAQTGRWFVTTLEIDVNPFTGALANSSSELIAVSATSDPTGNYGLFELPSSNDGSSGQPNLANCPCFGDQPRIGADANGFYISDDVYSIQNTSANSDGGFLYAISKQELVDAASSGGQGTPSYVGIWIGAIPIMGYPANAVQPAETPQTAAYPSDREYFLSTPDFNGFATTGGQGASSVVLWTLLNTSTLNSASPSLTLTNAIVPSEAFTPPVNAVQKPGPAPLGQSLGDPVQPLNVDDDRMQQVEYLGGHLYSSLSTGVGSGSTARTGTAWFEVATSGTSGAIAHQGYLATGGGASLMYPAIGLNANGRGVLTFSVAGPNVYPSGAYIPFNHGPTGRSITVDGPGNLPEDGFTCYQQFGFGPPCRWGDYSAASSDGSGHIVTGDEMITNVERDPGANWDTFIATLKP